MSLLLIPLQHPGGALLQCRWGGGVLVTGSLALHGYSAAPWTLAQCHWEPGEYRQGPQKSRVKSPRGSTLDSDSRVRLMQQMQLMQSAAREKLPI